jgi:hypothetical protein
MKKLVVFDLDGTLAQSKSTVDDEIATLLDKLLGLIKVADKSSANWLQFQWKCALVRSLTCYGVRLATGGTREIPPVRKSDARPSGYQSPDRRDRGGHVCNQTHTSLPKAKEKS